MLRLRQCNGNKKRCSLPLFTFNSDIPVHQFHDIFGNSHSKPCASVFVGIGRILLAEGVKNKRQVVLAYADPCIADQKAKGCLSAEPGSFLYSKCYCASPLGKLYGIAEDVDKHLAKLRFVADKATVSPARHSILVMQTFIGALCADDGIYPGQHF